MLSALLRSGDIKNYTALGQDGTPVYAVASQLRDAIRLRVRNSSGESLGKKFANYLAIPQRNDQGSQIDWYVPFESERSDGKYLIIPWTSATDEERTSAYQELHQFEQAMLDFGLKLKNTNNLQGDLLLFSRLLCGNQNPTDLNDPDNLKALRFPNPEHIYLVNGKPVITFWGFVEKNSNIQGHPFLSLKPAIKQPIVEPLSPPPQSTPIVETRRPWWRWLLCLLPFLLIGALSLFFLRGCWSPTVSMPTLSLNSDKTATDKNTPTNTDQQVCLNLEKDKWFYLSDGKEVTDQTLIDKLNASKNHNANQCQTVVVDPITKVINVSDTPNSVTNGNAVTGTTPITNTPLTAADTADNTPLVNDQAINDAEQPADNSQTKEPAIKEDSEQPKVDQTADQTKEENPVNQQGQSADPTTPQNNSQPQPQNQPLQIPATSLQNGNVDFLNGKWNAGAGIQDKSTGKPLRLKYEFANGKGQVRVERGDGVQCVGNVNAAMQGKNLNIGNSGIANCSDGSTYQLPNVSCKPNANGSADCEGEYGQGQNFPMSMKSE